MRRPRRDPEPERFREPAFYDQAGAEQRYREPEYPGHEPESGGREEAAPPGRDFLPRLGRSRAAAARRRRSQRRLVTWGGAALAVVVLAGGGYLLSRSPAPKSNFVTSWQKGEIRSVPNACKIVGTAALRQYLAGTPTSTVPNPGSGQSQCTYTVDAKPTFRVLNIQVQAYAPTLNAPGNGSATSAAEFNFGEQKLLLVKPPKNMQQPPATISPLTGLGSEALTAVQVFRRGMVSDRVTVMARYRNVVVTVQLQGQSSGGFGPVTVPELRSGAIAVARDLMAKVQGEPAVS